MTVTGAGCMEDSAATPTARIAGFMAHLRLNGFMVGLAEAEDALSFLSAGDALDLPRIRLGLKTMLTGDREQWDRFDALFDAYWFGRGVRSATAGTNAAGQPVGRNRPTLWDFAPPDAASGNAMGPMGAVGGDGEDEHVTGRGRLVASRRDSLTRTDLRRLVSPQDIAEAERVASRLARAIRYRLSRRRKAARRGREADLRRTIRRNMSRGGEPLDIVMRRRPLRPARLVLLVDVSGSMKVYSRYFLSFVRGLLGLDIRADAFLFHTRLVRITGVSREADPMRAMTRLSLLAEGFGGGTRIAECLRQFNDRYAREVLDSRSVVVIMSDGYDTDEPEALAAQLRRLKLRARRLVWLNPLLGWRDYTPVARGMAASLPHIDLFAAAHTLDALAALEGELARL